MTFQKDDRVYSIRYESWGVVKSTEDSAFLEPISVLFTTGEWEGYTRDGKLTKDHSLQDLFFAKPKIIAPEEPARLPPLSVDAPVLVRTPMGDWTPRHFHSWRNNQIRTYPNGKTSWTSKDGSYHPSWAEWKLPIDEGEN